MSESVFVSVILPTFNREEYLERAVKSVIDQTYQDWELIIWDDGSTDQTEELVRSFREKRIQYFCEQNQGVAYARNQAISKSHGGLIAFLDSDDAWHPEKLSKQLRAMESFPQIDLLFSDFMNFDMVNDTQRTGFQQELHGIEHLTIRELDDGLNLIEDGMPESLALGNFIATDTVMVKREILDELGGFDGRLRNSEDFELWWRLGLAGKKFAFLNEVLLNRNKPAGTLSGASVVSAQNTLNALDLCCQATLSTGRDELVPYLEKRYRNTWQNLIAGYAREGDRKGINYAFRQSLKYGLRPGSIRLWLQGWLAATLRKGQ
jgi:glycosyltransferase involved in cell wall biosynthesis